MQKNTQAFNENLFIICDELHLAEHWGKASIIFTIHKDIFSQAKTKRALNKKLKESDNSFVEIEINKVKGNFIDYLLQHQKTKNPIFFISNIGWGGGRDNKDFYRILNLYRETFIEQRIKIIFFLTRTEASNLANFAPDFWAFRHRVLEFAGTRKKKKPPVGIMLWQLEPLIFQDTDFKGKISNLKKMQKEIPKKPESVTLRIDLEYEIGCLCWQEGDLVGAEKALKAGLDLATFYNINEVRTKIINGLAILNYEREKYQKSIELLEPLVNENPGDCLLILNQAISIFAMNKKYSALRKGIKAKNLCSKSPWVVSSLGFLYYFAGKIEEAVACFQKAVDMVPTSDIFNEALVVCYLALGLEDNAKAQLDQVKEYSIERKLYHDVLKACVEDKKENALKLIKEAINVGELTKLAFAREPILYTLFDSNKVTLI